MRNLTKRTHVQTRQLSTNNRPDSNTLLFLPPVITVPTSIAYFSAKEDPNILEKAYLIGAASVVWPISLTCVGAYYFGSLFRKPPTIHGHDRF